GCVVLRAYGGAEGIELARRCRPDLILLDLQMPEVSGFEVVEALKEDPASAAIPIVVVTGRDVNAPDRRRLSGRVRDLSHRTAFDQGRFAGEVQRA
ncbi:response regulator, partial [Enterococcus casseliflavus]|uniref:response regulator n=1 Tax=Enterococcus casseliflavus TaxID=37734 RepID=UPI003D0E2EFD